MSGHKTSWYLIDSNIFLRLLVRDNERMWQDCVELFKCIGDSRVHAYIPSLVTAEVQFVLSSFYGFDRFHIIAALKSIAATANLRIYEDLDLSRAISLYEQNNIKFIDCYLASSELIVKGEASMISYDKDFDRLGVTRIDPAKLVTTFS